MKTPLAIIIAILAVCFGWAETLDEFKARIVAQGIVQDTGKIVDQQQPLLLDSGKTLTIANLFIVRTTNADGHEQLTKMLIHMYSDNTVVQADSVRNFEAPAPTAAEQIVRGRAAIRAMIENAVPIPASPSAQLPFEITKDSWAGQTITEYRWPRDKKSADGQVTFADVILTLSTDGDTEVRITVDPSTNYFVVEPVK